MPHGHGSPDRSVHNDIASNGGGGGDGCCDETNTTLAAILVELAQKLEAGQEVALTAASLAALENITATVSGTVALDGPTLVALETVNAVVSGEVALDAVTLAALENITVSVSNFPATQPVSGTVEVTNDVGNPLPVSGTVDNPVLTDAHDDPNNALRVNVVASTGGGLTDAELRASPVPVDTELPAAAVLADNTVNPTSPAVAAFGMVYDGSTWDRMRGTQAFGVLANLNAINDAAGDDELKTWFPANDGNELWFQVIPKLWDGSAYDRTPGDSANGMDVDVTRSALPTGAATSAKQDTQQTALDAIKTAVELLDSYNGVIKDNSGDDCTVKVAHLDMTTATTTDIVAAVPSKKIRVIEYEVVLRESVVTVINFARGAGTTRVTGSPLMGRFESGSAVEWQRTAPARAFLFETDSGEALRVTQTGAADISVAIVYIEVD